MREVFPEISLNNFEFTKVITESVENEILKLTVCWNSPTFSTNVINSVISEGEFPDKLRKPEVIPLYKKQDFLKRENYRLVFVFWRILYAQIIKFMENKLSKFIASFCKSHGTQHFFNDYVREIEKCAR